MTRKITRAAARIEHGLQEDLVLGNLNSKRDWGYAPEYTQGMWAMLQQASPRDYVLATNETHTVREFVDLAFREVGIPLEFRGEGAMETGVDPKTGKVRVRISPQYYRPTEVDLLIGDYSRAKNELGWEPKTRFEDLVKMMARSDFEKVKRRGY